MNILPLFGRALLALIALASATSGFSAATEPAAPAAMAARPMVSMGHTLPLTTARISPDGKRLFTMDRANIRAWEIESGKELKLLHSYGGGESTWDTTWTLVFDEEKKMVIVPRHFETVAFNYETLEPLAGWLHGGQVAVWDPKTRKTYYCDTDGRFGTFVFGELDETKMHGSRWRRTRIGAVKLAVPEKFDAICRALLLLEDGKLLADTNAGRLLFDPATGHVSHAKQEPTRTTTGVMQFDDHFVYPLATFKEPLPVEIPVHAGPQGTLLTFAPATKENKKVTTIEVLSARDLRPLRSGQINSDLVLYSGPQSYEAQSKKLWLRGARDVFAIDFETLAIRENVPLGDIVGAASSAGAVKALEPLPTPSQWVVVSEEKIFKYDISAKRVLATLGDGVLGIRNLATSPRGFEFVLSDDKSQAKRVRILPNGLEVTTASRGVNALAYDPSGETVAQGSVAEASIKFTELPAWKKVDYTFPASGSYNYGTANTLIYSNDGKILVVKGAHGVVATALETGKTLLDQRETAVYKLDNSKLPIALSPDNRWIVSFDTDRIIRGYDLQSGKKAWEQKLQYDAGMFYFVGPRVFGCLSNGNFQFRASDTGALLAEHDPEGWLPLGRSHAVSQDKKFLAVGKEFLRVFEAETGKMIFESRTDTTVTSVAFFANPRYLVTASADNLLRLWDTTQKRELCTLALFQNDDEWVLSTPELRFDASEKAVDKMYVVKGGDIIPLESLFEKLYTPKLLASLLAGEKLEPPAIDLQKLTTPPTVKIAFANGTRNLTVEDDTAGNEVDVETTKLTAVAEARDSSVSEIRLFQNGKLLTVATGKGAKFTQSFDARLTPGENVFRAIALNADRTESRPSEVVVTYRPKAGPAIAGSAPEKTSGGLQLHLLIVGVNTYKNPKYNLNYAVADATAVKQTIEAQTKAIFTAVNVSFILNEQAGKATITDAFKAISARASPRDVFVFYYAGHGVMTSDAKPDFFLVPHDVLQLYGADDALRQKGISSTELMELSKTMPAQKQLFILDACQSAGALTTVAMRGAAEEKAIAQLARSTGTHWLTASGSEQFATEFAQLGHGAFTYALIEGLAGKADTGDGRVTVNELKAWLETQVPELTQKHKGTPQYPSSYGFGQDFPVAVIAK